MENYKELYILGQPINTKIGQIHFIKVEEYCQLLQFIPYLELEKFDVINTISSKIPEVKSFFKDKEYIAIIHELKEYYELYNVYKQLFILCFKEDVFDKITTDEEFDMYRNLIRKMNCISHEERNPNPEIQYFNDLKKIYNKRKGEPLTFESMITSVWVEAKKDPFDLTIYQLHALFNRITQMKNYDTTILYSTVSSEVKVDLWYKHIDMFKDEEKELTSLEELQSKGW
jgi:hypothetical protein